MDNARELNRNRERSMNVIQNQLDSKAELVSKLNSEIQVYECQRLGLKTAHDNAIEVAKNDILIVEMFSKNLKLLDFEHA